MRRLKRRITNYSKRFQTAARTLVDGPSASLDILEVDGLSVAFRRNTSDERVIAQSFDKDIFFAAVPHYQPGPDDVVLDVGAHIGTFAMAAARSAGRVYAIEASRDSFNYLRINLALNALGNVEANHLALSDRDGTVRLHHDRDGNWGHSITAKLSASGEDVVARSLQTFLDERSIGRVAFAKFNCEGAEFPILMAAEPAVLQRMQLVIVLLHEDLAEGHRAGDLVHRFKESGFSVELRNMRKKRGWLIGERKG